jgi:hypothetical protein
MLCLLCACGSTEMNGDDGASVDATVEVDAAPPKAIRTVFVIPFENKANSQIYGNTTDAPYINSLITPPTPIAAHATMFGDALPTLPSEPHYVWMEAGTNTFTDRTFTNDNDPSASNSTASADHLVTTLSAASISWMSYQEGITSNTCPIKTSGHYVAKHDPFVFFKDVAGSPPDAATPACADHHKAYSDFAGDLANGVTGYVFITPDLCHDMHGAVSCPSFLLDGPNIKAGDDWLAAELPRIIAYTQAHDDAVIFLTWDEGDSTNVIPFLAIGKYVKAGYTSTVPYTHGSLIATVQTLFHVPLLTSVTSVSDFRDMFEDGLFE